MLTDKHNATMIASLFPVEVVTDEINPVLVQDSIYPEEQIFIYDAILKRKREFIAGRLCARRALAKFGIKSFPILMGKDRAPIWPSGIVGSISHCEGYCGVAVAQKTDIESVGLDIECVGQVNRNTWKHFCNQQELSWINSLPVDDQQKNAALIFSAKECVYKCQYPISKEWLSFHDVAIFADINNSKFEARILIDIGEYFKKGACLKGKYFFSNSYVFTSILLKNPHDPYFYPNICSPL